MDASFPDLAAGIPELPTTIVRTRGGYELLSRVRVPRPIDEVFTFFSNPRNLQELTPDHVGFRILNEGEIEMKEGATVNCLLTVYGFVSIKWDCLIQHWDPPHRFVDIQTKGPFRSWAHEHAFVDEGDSTLIQDHVQYRVPGGRLAHALFVKRDQLKVFNHRARVIRERWGTAEI